MNNNNQASEQFIELLVQPHDAKQVQTLLEPLDAWVPGKVITRKSLS